MISVREYNYVRSQNNTTLKEVKVYNCPDNIRRKYKEWLYNQTILHTIKQIKF